MATRREMKKAVYDDILLAVDIPDEQVVYAKGQVRNLPYPHISYHLFDVPKDVYGTKPRPYDTLYDTDGNKIASVYAAYYTAFVDIQINADAETTDALYEPLREQFLKYIMWEQEWELHDDVNSVRLGEAGTPINTDSEPSVFESMVSVEIDYWKDITRDGVPIEKIYQNYDIDADSDPETVGDGTTDLAYTTE